MQKEATRFICIIKGIDIYGYDDCTKFIDSVTNWSEVTESEYKLLVSWCSKYDYKIVERFDTKADFLPKTIARALQDAEAYALEMAIAKKASDEKKLQAALKRKAKSEEQEKKLLEELQRKYNEGK